MDGERLGRSECATLLHGARKLCRVYRNGKTLRGTNRAVAEKFVSNKSYDAVMLGMEDNYNTCDCTACRAVKERYGSLSATVILFLDDVADLVEAWMKQNPEYARDLQYMFLRIRPCFKRLKHFRR